MMHMNLLFVLSGSAAELAEFLREQKISWLSKQDPKSEEAARTYAELKEDAAANQVQVRMARLASVLGSGSEAERRLAAAAAGEEDATGEAAVRARDVAEICGEVRERIRVNDLLAHAAMKQDPRPDAAEIKKDMDKQRGWFVEAMCKLGLSQLALGQADAASETLLELLKVADAADSKVSPFGSAHAEVVGHHARALKLALAQLDSKPGVKEVEQRYMLKYCSCNRFAINLFSAESCAWRTSWAGPTSPTSAARAWTPATRRPTSSSEGEDRC